MQILLRYKSGRVEQIPDVDTVHDGRLGLLITHRKGIAVFRRSDVAQIEITVSPNVAKSPDAVTAAPYLQRLIRSR